MTRVLWDTSALVALFVQSETRYDQIERYVLENSDLEWVILSTVLDETVTWMRAKISPKASIQVGCILRQEHTYINLSDSDDKAVWDAFCNYDDKRWSYTDCSLLAMSNRLGIANVVSFDSHIKQMSGLGIICVP